MNLPETEAEIVEIEMAFVSVDDFSTLEGSNTFRIGQRYDSVLSVGQLIGICNGDADNEQVGVATIKDIFTGSFGDMLQKHGEANHLLAGEHSEVRVEDLKSFLVDNYGDAGHVVDRMTPFTVIYFENFQSVEEDATGGPIIEPVLEVSDEAVAGLSALVGAIAAEGEGDV